MKNPQPSLLEFGRTRHNSCQVMHIAKCPVMTVQTAKELATGGAYPTLL